MELLHGDCIEKMKGLPDRSFDLILTDPPYGTTACKWDTVIPFQPMWEQLNRVIKPKGCIAMFGNQPFTSSLIASNLKGFKYCWQWDKKIPSGMGYAKYRPMQQTEDVCIFSLNGGPINYYPQMIKREKAIKSGGNTVRARVYDGFNCMGEGKRYDKTYTEKFPTTLIQFAKIRKGGVNPTQKPVELLEYLILTYTLAGERVLDFAMGSGSTGVACAKTIRDFVGIELNAEYFSIAKDRIEAAT